MGYLAAFSKSIFLYVRFILVEICFKIIMINIATGTTDSVSRVISTAAQMVPFALVANLATRWHHLH